MSEILDNLWLGDVDVAKNNSTKDIIIVNCATELTETRFDYKIDLFDGVNELNTFNDNIEKTVDYINEKMNANKIVLVHCMAGASRSATVIIYYLMKYNKMTFSNAYNYVKQKRSIVNINKWFYKWFNARNKS